MKQTKIFYKKAFIQVVFVVLQLPLFEINAFISLKLDRSELYLTYSFFA